ncbi:hypothetical protein [Halalkalibacter alkalisediminis]|uniref:Uncharacterized protein n=1 Tax=Halalkalibacter alkalisediminis TaxID=935616 RepID=A0ABV6NF28_9BACI|nr:hypothetical protein [Halalkalibacter alkalisediminis]
MFYQAYYQFEPTPYRQFPPVDTSTFEQSLQTFQALLEQGRTLVNSLVTSEERMFQLMDAAQRSDDQEVDRIIRETGIASIVETSYSPTGVSFTLRTEPPCCTLTMYLVWGR